MNKLTPDTGLEDEIQELYILAGQWMKDVCFMEDEIRFFNNILCKYNNAELTPDMMIKKEEFEQEVSKQAKKIDSLKSDIPAFLVFLKPFVGNEKEAMNLHFIEKYSELASGLTEAMNALKATKNKLFTYAERIMASGKIIPVLKDN
ncbi:hypothetical protein ACFGVS_00250 [Mucilaginibacter sp. AW1-7]|jgi:hypothetical protein|uniref:hypothetical protein n=1 Tax=unclassified Mucilaginibacter TaxID=2617802 RepID=UPI0008CFFD5F|nr:hypothetical protein [Mucilaginibacter sp. OK283]SEP44559.1 hypothetical protein SAMN05428947_12023 [Mucilaginibacter sp. OK283]